MKFSDFGDVRIEHIPFIKELYEFDSVVFVLNDKSSAAYIHSLLEKTNKSHELIYLDFFDSEIYETTFSDYNLFIKRAAALSKILTSKKRIIVTTIAGINYKVPTNEYFADHPKIFVHQKQTIKYIVDKLIEFGYTFTDVVRSIGQFAVRGGIVDVFIPTYRKPFRIDFLGNEIDSIREFDSETQISKDTVLSAVITKCTETILNDESKHLFKQEFTFDNQRIIETVENGNFFPGIEWYLRCFHQKTTSILSYLDKATKFIFEFEIKKHNNAFFDQAAFSYARAKEALPVADIFHDSISEIHDKYSHTTCNPFGGSKRFKNILSKYNIRNSADLQDFIQNISGTTIFSLTTIGAFNITSDLLQKRNIEKLENFFDAKPNTFNLIISDLKSGFLSKEMNIYTENELFGEELKFAAKRPARNILRDYSRLSINDYVVHEKHGIAVFEGLINLDVSGFKHDFLSLRYKNDDHLYVPVENISLITRYGGDRTNVQLDSLKSGYWTKRKENIRKKLLVIANNLIQVAAKRLLNKVQPLKIPSSYKEFCDGFGYVETEDQLNAINDVVADLEGSTPMDRLVCGDVGFGKTEVAMRAAFIVASAKKQVVLLAPTTILVSQHYKCFKKRFDKFGINICQLSRFVPAKKLKQNIADIESGTAKIIIATHTVLSKKIKFFDLKLVIIDEEQHFGVKQKEFLKEIYSKTHLMTLSATPIPRTLQLSISGIKDLSMITTPPSNRRPVRTVICDFEDDIIKQAIENETKIGGQVFFITPRVEFLDDIYNTATKLFPNLVIRKAHGKSDKLEDTIRDFCDCKIDVLVSTNIIDSGIDIPNANTILIHRFDLFGLSQLYQLRGRVGRSKRQAYAYLLVDKYKTLTQNAKKRLEVLGTLNKLGSGFNLASYDLDIRGAGNLLGDEQSGYIREIGIELYQTMLYEAILMLKAGYDYADLKENDPQINLGIPIFIPESYINESSLRLEIYRRIGSLETEENVDAMEFELSNRFGPVPFEAKCLLRLIRIKINCKKANIEKLDVGPSGFTFSFFGNKCDCIGDLIEFLKSDAIKSYSGSARIRPDQKVVITKKWSNTQIRTEDISQIIHQLIKITSKA